MTNSLCCIQKQQKKTASSRAVEEAVEGGDGSQEAELFMEGQEEELEQVCTLPSLLTFLYPWRM